MEQKQNMKRPEGYTCPEEMRSLISNVLIETREKGLSKDQELEQIMRVLFNHETTKDEARLKRSNAYEVR